MMKGRNDLGSLGGGRGLTRIFFLHRCSCNFSMLTPKDLLKAGYSCLALHGGVDQQDRDSNLRDFKEGNVKLLIATSVAARGLDVKHLNLVPPSCYLTFTSVP
jgi:superfamily II DNA/RNA helicase